MPIRPENLFRICTFRPIYIDLENLFNYFFFLFFTSDRVESYRKKGNGEPLKPRLNILENKS